MSQVNAKCPGKIIITGEHSVVYQQPAIALAVRRYSCASWQPQQAPNQVLNIELPDLGYSGQLANPDVLQAQLTARQQANPHQLPLCEPQELVGAAMQQGGHITVSSELPLGSGMGSSASVIGACLKARYPTLANEQLVAHATLLENFQHGRSSGLDVRTCLLGGLQSLNMPTPQASSIPPAIVIHTGIPRVSTAEVVAFVRQQPPSIWDEFGAVSRAVADSLNHQQSVDDFYRAIQANHQLLCAIGVVPERVQTLITAIEKLGGVAKIAGAGAHQGEHGGIVVAWGIDSLTSPYASFHAQADWQGATVL